MTYYRGNDSHTRSMRISTRILSPAAIFPPSMACAPAHPAGAPWGALGSGHFCSWMPLPTHLTKRSLAVPMFSPHPLRGFSLSPCRGTAAHCCSRCHPHHTWAVQLVLCCLLRAGCREFLGPLFIFSDLITPGDLSHPPAPLVRHFSHLLYWC